MLSRLTTFLHPGTGRQLQCRLGKYLRYPLLPLCFYSVQIYPVTRCQRGFIGFGCFEQFTCKGPTLIQGLLHTRLAFHRAVAQADDPLGAPFQMIGCFLQALFGHCGKAGIAAFLKLRIEEEIVGIPGRTSVLPYRPSLHSAARPRSTFLKSQASRR